MNKIKKCPGCGGYTFSSECKGCDKKTIDPKPLKYSPEDRYGDYRRKQIDRHEDGE